MVRFTTMQMAIAILIVHSSKTEGFRQFFNQLKDDLDPYRDSNRDYTLFEIGSQKLLGQF